MPKDTSRVCVSLRTPLFKWFKACAKVDGLSISGEIASCLETFAKEHSDGPVFRAALVHETQTEEGVKFFRRIMKKKKSDEA